jgi:transcriptional regulator with PAS, ATPase and Fis domain
MLTYDWPGNARQLAHAIERMAILSDDMLIDSVHLLHRCIAPEQQQRRQSTATTIAPESRSLKRIVQDYEFMIIQQSIEQHGSIRKAAAALKTSHATLSRKITEYHLLPPESERTLK